MIRDEWKNMTAFTSVSLGGLDINTRFVRSATELFRALPDGHICDFEYDVYRKLAVQPIGLIITAHTCVSPEGRSNAGQNAVWDDMFDPDHAAIADIIHSGGFAKTVMQIGHGGMKAEGSNGGRPVYTPDNMTLTQIKEVKDAFIKAAGRAKACGYDGVELHCAHMYLLSQFFYPQYNHRTDSYGGGGAGRIRITSEILRGIKAACGDDFPVLVKLNCDNNEDNETYFREVLEAVDILYKNGCDALEVSGYYSSPVGIPKEPYFMGTASKIAASSDISVIQVGGIRTPGQIDRILAGKVKAVSFSRPFTSQPDFIERIYGGGKSRCVSCNKCAGLKGKCVLEKT